MKILVVDDKPMNLRSAHKTLSGHDVTTSPFFDEAMTFHLNEKIPKEFDVVLTDLMLPLDGAMIHDCDKRIDLKQQIPLGFIIALKAISLGVKFVAIVTDIGHNALEAIAQGLVEANLGEIKINGGKAMIYHAELLKEEEDLVNLPCRACRENPGLCRRCYGLDSLNTGGEPKSSMFCDYCEKTNGLCPVCKGISFAPQPAKKDWGKVLAKLIA
jgi:CheY-like chemotaxis protein